VRVLLYQDRPGPHAIGLAAVMSRII